ACPALLWAGSTPRPASTTRAYTRPLLARGSSPLAPSNGRGGSQGARKPEPRQQDRPAHDGELVRASRARRVLPGRYVRRALITKTVVKENRRRGAGADSTPAPLLPSRQGTCLHPGGWGAAGAGSTGVSG